MSGDHAVRLRDDAPGWGSVSDDIELTPEDPVLDGLSEEKAEDLVRSQWALVHHDPADSTESTVDSPFDPGEHTVDDLEAKLDDNEYTDGELDALEAAERDGDDRETALEAIEAAQEG